MKLKNLGCLVLIRKKLRRPRFLAGSGLGPGEEGPSLGKTEVWSERGSQTVLPGTRTESFSYAQSQANRSSREQSDPH